MKKIETFFSAEFSQPLSTTSQVEYLDQNSGITGKLPRWPKTHHGVKLRLCLVPVCVIASALGYLLQYILLLFLFVVHVGGVFNYVLCDFSCL